MVRQFVQVEGFPDLVRDTKSGAILNINKSNITTARMAKQARKSQAERLDRVEEQLTEIASILKMLVEKNG